MKWDTQLVGAAGEYLVLSRLLNRQYLAAQAPPGAAKVDILVNHLDGKPPRLIQVKTITGKNINNGWRLGHSDISTTLRIYAHIRPEQKQEVADLFARAIENG